MIKLKYFLSVCVVIIIFLIYFYFYPGNKYAQRENGNDEYLFPDDVEDNIRKKLRTVVEQLQESKSIGDWFQYIRNNSILTVNNQKLYLFCYESVDKDKTKFQVRVYYDSKYENMMWEDIFATQQNNFVFIQEKTDKDLIANMYSSTSRKKESIRYYWTNPVNKSLTAKQAVVEKWDKDGRSGIVGMGYTVKNLSETNKIIYQDFVNPFVSICYLVLTAIITILLIRKNLGFGLFFFIFSTLGFVIYVGTEEFTGSAQSENDKTVAINSMILSISFLLGVNLFILNSLRGDKPKSFKTFNEVAVLFCSSLVLILASILYFSSSSDVPDLMQNRISKQLMFILAVIINICIIIAFFIHVFQERKIWSLKPNVTKHANNATTHKSVSL